METELDSKGGGCIYKGLLSIYFCLYLIFAFDEFFPLDAPNSWDMEHSVLKMLFLIFLIGFALSWKYEFVSGVIFIFWFLVMCYHNFFLCTTDCGIGIAMGVPLLILGISFIVIGIKKKRSNAEQIKLCD